MVRKPNSAKRVAETAYTPGRPKSWPSAVTAASYRAVGATQIEAARAAGVSERTLGYWESADWWPEAMREAVAQHHLDLRRFALKRIRDVVKSDEGDVRVAQWLLERMEPEVFGQRVDHTSGGQPLRVAVMIPDPRNAGFGGDGDGD